MASTRGIRAGRAFVELFADDSKLVRGLRRAERKVRAFGDSIRGFGLKMAGAISAVIAPLGVLTIRAAADAQESLSRFEQVFKDQADAAGAFADALADSVGRSKYEIRDALATFQSFFLGLGFGSSPARELSQSLQTLALDFASFNNISDAEAIQRFIAALSGSGEVLDRFGINIKQAALQQELLRMGIAKSWTQVTEQEKALARLNIITRAMGDQGAVGDAVRTAGSFTNQMKRLRGQVRDAAVEIGQSLLPIVTPLVAKVAEAARWFGQWVSRNQQLIATIFKVAAGAVAVGAAIAALGTVVAGFGAMLSGAVTVITTVVAALELLGTAIALLVSPIGLVIAALAGMAGYLISATSSGGKALDWLSDRFTALKDGAMASFRGIADALQAGDIALAAKILWSSLKLAWLKGTEGLRRTWESFQAGLTGVFIDLTATLKSVWAEFLRLWRSTTEVTANWLAKRMLEIQGLFDESLDVDYAKRHAEQQSDAALRDIDKQATDRKQEIEAERRQRQKLNQDQHNANVAAQEAAVQAARAEWQAAIDEAKRAPAPGSGDAAPGSESTAPGSLDDPDAIINRAREALAGLGDIGELVEAEAAKIGVKGTFNAAALRGLNSGGAADRTAQATEETAKHTKKLVQSAQTGGLTFA